MSRYALDRPTFNEIEGALFTIPANLPHEDWARIAMSLHSELGGAGFELFTRWSMQADTYSASSARSTWQSATKARGVSIGTLLHHARANGWTRAKRPHRTREEWARLEAMARERDTDRAHRDAQDAIEKAAAQASAARIAKAQLDYSTPADPSHPYLDRKGITPDGIRQAGAFLLVPIQDAGGRVVNMQTIDREGTKRFTKGGRVTGCVAIFGKPLESSSSAVICEGVATAKSLLDIEGSAQTAIVAFNAGNLKPAALAVREKWPGLVLAIGADWDEPCGTYPNAGGIGYAKACDAARAVDCEVWHPVLPQGVATGDFNDLALIVATAKASTEGGRA